LPFPANPGFSVAATALLPARYYLQLLGLLEAQGLPRAVLLRAAQLPRQRLRDPQAGLRLEEVERLSRAALSLAAVPDLGWQLGAAIRPAEHATLGHALRRACSLDAALRLASRYFALLSPGFQLRYHPGPQRSRIEVLPRLPFGPQTLRLHLDAILVATLTELEELACGPLPGVEVHNALPAPSRARPPPVLCRYVCRFAVGGLPGFSLTLPSPPLQTLRVATAAAQDGLARQRLERERDRWCRRAQLADWVRMMLGEAQGGLPTQPELAALWGLSTRSFGRRLAVEGVSFRTLVNAARIERALRALGETATPITQLALELGYRDAGNFSRAFRRAMGCTPRAFRARR
jgi:AraC-like DNA-binding protein